jgi:hypothetical protein
MRYYAVKIVNPVNKKVLRTFTSFKNNANDPGAPDVELDVPVTYYAIPSGNMGGQFVRIWGISLADIGQASNFNGMTIEIYGGMQKGLPLANPKQSGLLATGIIQQAFGNWLGLDMTLDFVFTAGNAGPNSPSNLTVQWKAGTPLSSVIDNTLRAAFPTYSRSINISPKLVLNHDEPGFYGTLVQFANYLNEISKSILGGTYRGVDVLLRENQFIVNDGTTKTTPKVIAFTDLVGQITWRSSATVSITCVMRADIQVGDYVKLPPGLATTTAQSYSQYRSKSAFQGVFQINSSRHVGRLRNPNGNAWVTVYEASGPVPQDG